MFDTKQGSAYCLRREVYFTADQQALVQNAIANGRLHQPEDAMQEALLLWERRERRRAELLADIQLAEMEIGQGEGREITRDSMRLLAEEVSQRGRSRLAAEQQSR